MSKNLVWIIIGVVAIALIGWYFLKKDQPMAPANTAQEDVIVQELSGLDLGDLNKEFSDIETEIQGL